MLPELTTLLEETSMLPSPEFLAHYTRPPALIEICRRRALLAGVAANMNDWREQRIAVQLCERALEFIGEGTATEFLYSWRAGPRELDTVGRTTPGIFTVSFSSELDSLEQWRAYAPDPGSMALVFSWNQLERVGEEAGFQLVPCIYDPTLHAQLSNSLVESFLPRITSIRQLSSHDLNSLVWEFHHSVSTLAAILKDPSFKMEQEWRLISPARAYWEPENYEYLPGPRGIRQFLSVSLAPAFTLPEDQCTFTIGPNGDVDQMVQVAGGLGYQLAGPKFSVSYRYSETSLRTY